MKYFLPSIKRRNSIVEFVYWGGNKAVRKSYRQVYNASDEFQLYQRLNNAFDGIRGVGVPEVYDVNERDNSITLEYVQGNTLDKQLHNERFEHLEEVLKLLQNVCVILQRDVIAIDLDPSNIIVRRDPVAICIIDPIASPNRYDHFSCAVLLVGFFKSAASLHGLRNLRRTVHGFQNIYLNYTSRFELKRRELDFFIVAYIDRVIEWNRTEPVGGSFIAWLRRRFFFPFVWKTVQVPFQLRIAFMRARGGR